MHTESTQEDGLLDDRGHARRRLLGLAAALPMVSGAAPARAADAPATKTSAHVVIVGSGLAGLSAAHRLRKLLDGAKITIVDRKEIHNYQPGYTLVASGIWPVDKVVDRNEDFMPSGVEWVRENAAEIDPVAKAVVTDKGRRIQYDFLVVATGLHLDYGLIEGMDTAAIGRDGIGSVYFGHEGAAKTWEAMKAFVAKGGNAVMTLPSTALKCAGAPLKMTFLLRDRLREAGTLAKSKVVFNSSLTNVFGVPAVNEAVLGRWDNLGIKVNFEHRLKAVDIARREATFVTPLGEEKTGYDFLHVVPPMRAPDVVKLSPLAWREGGFAGGGWLEVDEKTLRHRRFPEVFGIGDVNGTRRGKTAATVKKACPVATGNLAAVIAGKEPAEAFDGYTSCPLVVRIGSALLIEFDYDGKLTPTLPFIDPLQESWFAWLMKYRLLKPAYLAVLKGRA